MVGISDLASFSPPLTLLGVAACLLTSRSAHSEKVIESLLGPWLGADAPRFSPPSRLPRHPDCAQAREIQFATRHEIWESTETATRPCAADSFYPFAVLPPTVS